MAPSPTSMYASGPYERRDYTASELINLSRQDSLRRTPASATTSSSSLSERSDSTSSEATNPSRHKSLRIAIRNVFKKRRSIAEVQVPETIEEIEDDRKPTVLEPPAVNYRRVRLEEMNRLGGKGKEAKIRRATMAATKVNDQPIKIYDLKPPKRPGAMLEECVIDEFGNIRLLSVQFLRRRQTL